MASIEQPGEVPGVNVSGQGVQVGSGNTQYNAWGPKPPLDPAALSGLNPHTAVERLLKLTHDELVDFFACAKPEDMSEILEIFLFNERLKLIAVLGDISRRKAADLIATIDASEALRVLPDAAYEISRKAASLRFANGGSLQPVNFPKGALGPGYFRKYDTGRVWWSRFGTYETVGPVDEYCTTAATSFNLGVPVSDLESTPSSPFGTNGLRQKFERGTVYSSPLGAFCVTNFSGGAECYHDQGGTGEWLGFPVEDCQARLKPSGIQNFEGGAIYTYSRVESGVTEQYAFAVRRNIASSLPDEGWRPVSKEAPAVSSFGWHGTVQHFEVELESGTYETAVYCAKEWQHGPMVITPGVWDYYAKLGAEKSWLGFPVTREYGRYLDVGRQDFEGGMIYWRPESDPICVRKAVDEFITQGHSIGYPVTEEHSVNSGESDIIQFFERGIVTMRDGRYEIWLRSDSNNGPPATKTDNSDAAVFRAVIKQTIVYSPRPDESKPEG